MPKGFWLIASAYTKPSRFEAPWLLGMPVLVYITACTRATAAGFQRHPIGPCSPGLVEASSCRRQLSGMVWDFVGLKVMRIPGTSMTILVAAAYAQPRDSEPLRT